MQINKRLVETVNKLLSHDLFEVIKKISRELCLLLKITVFFGLFCDAINYANKANYIILS
jgi:hypothetical protein